MQSATRVGIAALVASATLLVSVPSLQADAKTASLIEQLKKSPDHRVRALAALSLGTSDDAEATKPLCKCLGDASEVDSVRVACAAALGKLKRPGCEACLKENANDSSTKVKSAVAEAIKAMGPSTPAPATTGNGSTTCAKPPATGKPKYYVGVTVANKSTRADADVKPIVEREVRCHLTATPGYLVVSGEDSAPKKMAEVVAKEKLAGYFLSVSVEPIKYDSTGLKVSLKMVVMTHTRDLRGELTKSVSMPSVKTASKQKEESLIAAATQRLMEDWVATGP